jgi:hypothetical protein
MYVIFFFIFLRKYPNIIIFYLFLRQNFEGIEYSILNLNKLHRINKK